MNKNISLIILFVALAGCLPTIQKQWDVQPVEGTVVNGKTGAPIAGATISNLDMPTLLATSDGQGRFRIEEQTHTGFHMLMAGSALITQTWQIRHPDYPDAVAWTQTMIPALSRQQRTLTVPLFSELPPSPDNCPDFGYLLRLGQWQTAHNRDMRFGEWDKC